MSVGEKFKNKKGVRVYLEKFFVGYKTRSVLESIVVDGNTAKVRVDFTGEFGHETGGLDFTFDADGLIVAIDAWLE